MRFQFVAYLSHEACSVSFGNSEIGRRVHREPDDSSCLKLSLDQRCNLDPCILGSDRWPIVGESKQLERHTAIVDQAENQSLCPFLRLRGNLRAGPPMPPPC